MLMRFALLTAFALAAAPLSAQENNANFYQDLLISDELKAKEAKEKAEAQHRQQLEQAKNSARGILTTKTKNLKIDVPKVERRKTETPVQSDKDVAATTQNLDSAPFGLLWKASIEATKNLGVILTPIEQKDYVNSFAATHLPKDPKGFREIYLTFGEENELWRMIAYGEFINDTPDAAKVLKEYRMYSRLLSRKYGNAKEFFTPATKTVQKTVRENGQDVVKTEQIPEPMGNPNFLKQLQSGEADLYSTFEGDNIGAALAINVDGDGKSYIIINYTNIKILKEREEETLDIL